MEKHYRFLEELIDLNDDNDYTFVSGIAMYHHMYNSMGYADGLKLCLNLLSKCDVLLLDKDWESSKGCVAEWAYASGKSNIKCIDCKEELESSEYHTMMFLADATKPFTIPNMELLNENSL